MLPNKGYTVFKMIDKACRCQTLNFKVWVYCPRGAGADYEDFLSQPEQWSGTLGGSRLWFVKC